MIARIAVLTINSGKVGSYKNGPNKTVSTEKRIQIKTEEKLLFGFISAEIEVDCVAKSISLARARD